VTASIGTWSLTLSVLVAAGAALAAIASHALNEPKLLRTARRLIGLTFVLLTVTMFALGKALIDSDFSIAYVASYTELALPWGYKIAALWAGQEGSVLLWAWLLALMGWIFAINWRHRKGLEPAIAIASFAMVQAFFSLLLVIAANPFTPGATVPQDGMGLNPLLQHPSMISHPPLLFIGYAGFTVPFAMMLGALVAGRRDNQWIALTRRWLLISWGFLTVGILLGAQWAYVELGWGGYWAWDPVENASLLPWLTGTALLHSLGPHQRFGMFKRFNAGLIAASFLLCLLATYLTRSGVIQSVHAFGESLVGTFFLVFLILCTLVSIGVIAWRWRMLKPDQPLDSLVSRPGMFLMANWLLVLMTVVTAVGTMFPIFSGMFVEQPISVGQPFYNKVVVPMGLVLVALMSVGPLLRVGSEAGRELRRWMIIPLIIAGLAVLVAMVLGLLNAWALVCVAIVATAVAALLLNLGRLVLQRMKIESEDALTALMRLVDGDHRRFGGQMVHIGMFMLVAGTAGSSLFSVNQTMQMSPGDSTPFGQYTLTYGGLDEVRGRNYTAIEAKMTLTDEEGKAIPMRPQQRFYDKTQQPFAEVALRTSLTEDAYLTLAGWENNGQLAAFQGIINPLVSWIWIGGLVMTIGALFCLFPPLLPAAQPHSTSDVRTVHLAEPTCSEKLVDATETP